MVLNYKAFYIYNISNHYRTNGISIKKYDCWVMSENIYFYHSLVFRLQFQLKSTIWKLNLSGIQMFTATDKLKFDIKVFFKCLLFGSCLQYRSKNNSESWLSVIKIPLQSMACHHSKFLWWLLQWSNRQCSGWILTNNCADCQSCRIRD
jgi:hypothetical protein